MPELPEAEMARERLEAWLGGRRILGIEAPDPLVRRGQSVERIGAAVVGGVATRFRRRGKFVRIGFSGDRPEILSHLGMTGKWRALPVDAPAPKAVRAGFRLGGGERVVLVDPRRLARFGLLLPADDARLRRLGPEPLGSKFRADDLVRLTAATRRPIKALLMDQDRIAGIGNIQATESLWRAGIHPARPARELDEAEARTLWRNVRATLRHSLRRLRKSRAGESGEVRYVSEGGAGREAARAVFQVYAHEGDRCPKCREEAIVREQVAGRSSHFCPRCQPRRRLSSERATC